MDIRSIWTIVKRWWWLAVLLSVIGASIGYFTTPEPVPVYASTTTILLSQGTGGEIPTQAQIRYAEQLAETYQALMRTRSFLEEVIRAGNLQTSPGELAGRITVSSIENTNLLNITVSGSDPNQTRDIANDIVAAFIARNEDIQAERFNSTRDELEAELSAVEENLEPLTLSLYEVSRDVEQVERRIDQLDELEQEAGLSAAQISEREALTAQLAELSVEQNSLQFFMNRNQTRYQSLLSSLEEMRLLQTQNVDQWSVVELAITGRQINASGPQERTNAVQAGLIGLAIASAIAFVYEQLRARVIRSGQDVEELIGIPTLAAISDIKGTDPVEKLITERQPRSAAAEAYRVLRTNIEFAAGDEPLRTLVITSSSPVEGKTTTSANLAVAMAQSGKRTILVDTDLRRPTLHKYFQQTNTRGVTTALLRPDNSSISEHVVSTGIDNLFLMPSGPLPPNPADLLGSRRMADLVAELTENADFILFDSPPSLVVADATLLARICDATILVALADSTRVDMLRRSMEQVMQAGANLLGVVLNRISSGDGYYYYHSYYYTSDE